MPDPIVTEPVVEPGKPDAPAVEPAKPEKSFTQAQLDEIIKDRLARQQATFKAEQDKAAKQAEQEKLAEQNEYKPLAEQRKAELDKLEADKKAVEAERETFKAKAERYEQVLIAHATKQREGLAPSVLALLDKLPVDEQLEWIAANKADLVVDKTTPQGPPVTPRGNNAGRTVEQEAARAKQVQHNYKRQF